MVFINTGVGHCVLTCWFLLFSPPAGFGLELPGFTVPNESIAQTVNRQHSLSLPSGALIGQNLSSGSVGTTTGTWGLKLTQRVTSSSVSPASFSQGHNKFFFVLFLLLLLACLSSCLQFSSSLQHIELIPFILSLLLLSILFFW